MSYSGIKPSTMAAIRRYADHHTPTGGFLRAVLSNNLVEAVGMADEENLKALPVIVRYCYNEIPGNCWGSEQYVEKWLEQGREHVAVPGVLAGDKVEPRNILDSYNEAKGIL